MGRLHVQPVCLQQVQCSLDLLRITSCCGKSVMAVNTACTAPPGSNIAPDPCFCALHLVAHTPFPWSLTVPPAVCFEVQPDSLDRRGEQQEVPSWLQQPYPPLTLSFTACRSDEKWMHEPAVAGLLRWEQGVPGCTPPAGGKWRRCRPRWLVAEKVFLNMEWRASQASLVWCVALGALCWNIGECSLDSWLSWRSRTQGGSAEPQTTPEQTTLTSPYLTQAAYRWWASLDMPALLL